MLVPSRVPDSLIGPHGLRPRFCVRLLSLLSLLGVFALTSTAIHVYDGPQTNGHHKATGPVRIDIELPEPTTGTFLVTYRTTPERGLDSLRNELRLPQGGEVLEAHGVEAGAVEAQESREGWACARMPSGGDAAQIEVLAWFVFDTPYGGVFLVASELVTVGTGRFRSMRAPSRAVAPRRGTWPRAAVRRHS